MSIPPTNRRADPQAGGEAGDAASIATWPNGTRRSRSTSRSRALIAERHPGLDTSTLTRAGVGWDNVVWTTRDGVAFRFPRRQIAIAGIERGMLLLPELAPRVPLPIPDAAYPGAYASGSPGRGWQPVHRAPRDRGRPPDRPQRIALARALGDFLRTLDGLQLAEAAELPADPMRRADMAVRVPLTREALRAVAPLWTAPSAVADVLEQAERLAAQHASSLAQATCTSATSWSTTPARCFHPPAAPCSSRALDIRARQGMADLEHEAVSGLQRTLVG